MKVSTNVISRINRALKAQGCALIEDLIFYCDGKIGAVYAPDCEGQGTVLEIWEKAEFFYLLEKGGVKAK